jgi:hypothetical protein
MVGLYVLTGWAWTLVMLNLGMRTAFMQGLLPFLANQAVLPVYVVHLPIVLAISFVVVQLPLGLLPKALAIVGLGVGIAALVALVALRLPVLRVLLGARRRRPSDASATHVLRSSPQTAGS